MTANAALRDALVRLPKADLHLHVLGALRPATVVDLARNGNADLLPIAERALTEGYRFTDLTSFVEFFIGLFGLVRTAAEFERVTAEALEDAAAVGAVHAEIRFTPTSHVARGADEGALFRGVEAGRRAALVDHGITSRVVVDFPRTLPVSVAEDALDVALRHRAEGVVGLDIAGDEKTVAAAPHFDEVFRRARRAKLAVTAHAGEGAGPESVVGAIDRYGASRIGHGTRAVEDPVLVARLAREGVVLEVCPTSNEILGVVPRLAEHPVRTYLEAGVPCVVCTDDPALFGTDLAREFERLVLEVGLDLDAVAALAVRSLEAAFVEPGPGGEPLREHLAGAVDGVRLWRRGQSGVSFPPGGGRIDRT